MVKAPSSEVFLKNIKITVLNKSGSIIDEFIMRGGTNLWVFLRKRGLPIGSACSGVGVCGACNIKIVSADDEAITVKNDFEKNTLKNNNKNENDRLACLCRVFHDITIQAEYW